MRRLNQSLFFRMIFLILLVVFSAQFLAAEEPLKPQRYFLDNGLEVILAEMHRSPIIISMLYYKVGSRNESVGKTGISHVVEHMMFKGTKKFPVGEISKIIRRNSGVFNAFTSNDVTVYFEQMPKNKIDIALEVEADRMMNSVFDPEEFEDEVQVVKEERRLRVENNPGRILGEELDATFFMSHPYRWPVIGWMNDLDNITRDDAYQYYKTYYTPNNAVLVLVGDFDSKEMLEKVKKYFGPIPRGPEIKSLKIIEPEIRTSKTVTKTSPSIVNPKYYAYFQGVNYVSEDYPALNIAFSILARGRTSRLYQRLIKGEYCNRIRLGARRNIDMGPIVFSAELFPETSIDTVKKIFREEIERMKKEPVTAKELRRAKNRYKINSVYDNMKISDVASRLGGYEVKAGRFEYFDELREAYSRVTANDIIRVMNKYFNFYHMVEGFLLPGDTLTEQVPEISFMEATLEEGEEEPEEPDLVIAPDSAEQIPFDPKEFIRPRPIAPKLKTFKLKNGIEDIFYEDHTFPIIEISGVIEVGNATMNDELPGIGTVTADMLNQGSQRFPYEVLIDTLSMLATSVRFGGGDERVNFVWGTIKENFEAVTSIGADILKHPQFPEREFENSRKRRIATLEEADKKTGWKISRYVVDRVYEGHPYSRHMTIEGLKKMTLNDVRKYYQKYFRPELTKLIIIGDVSQKELRELLEKHLGDWKAKGKFEPVPYPEQKPIDTLEIKVFTNYEDKQVSIRISHEFPPRNHPDMDKLELANYILGGNTLTSRLGVNIRDKQGLTYGITSKIKSRNHGGWWFIQANTAPENVGKLIVSTFYEIDRMRKELVTETELNDAKRYYLGILPMVIETPLDVLSLLTDLVRGQKPLDDFDTYPDRLIPITREDVLEVSRKYYHPERCIIAVGGPITPEELKTALVYAETEMNLPIPVSFKNVEVGIIE